MNKLERFKKDLEKFYPTIPVVDVSKFSSEFDDVVGVWIKQEASAVTNMAGDRLFSNMSMNTINKRFKKFLDDRGFCVYEYDPGTKFLISK